MRTTQHDSCVAETEEEREAQLQCDRERYRQQQAVNLPVPALHQLVFRKSHEMWDMKKLMCFVLFLVLGIRL